MLVRSGSFTGSFGALWGRLRAHPITGKPKIRIAELTSSYMPGRKPVPETKVVPALAATSRGPRTEGMSVVNQITIEAAAGILSSDCATEKLDKIRELRAEIQLLEEEIIRSLPKLDRTGVYIIERIRNEGRDGIQPTTLIAATRHFALVSTKEVNDELDRLRLSGLIELILVPPLPGAVGRPKQIYRAL